MQADDNRKPINLNLSMVTDAGLFSASVQDGRLKLAADLDERRIARNLGELAPALTALWQRVAGPAPAPAAAEPWPLQDVDDGTVPIDRDILRRWAILAAGAKPCAATECCGDTGCALARQVAGLVEALAL